MRGWDVVIGRRMGMVACVYAVMGDVILVHRDAKGGCMDEYMYVVDGSAKASWN